MNEKNYYLHRISHEWAASKELFDKGFLSIGWSDFKNKGLVNIVKNKDSNTFNEIFQEKYVCKPRNRWCLWRFLEFKEDDIVVVPLPNGVLSICEVANREQYICEAEKLVKKYNESGVDIGFLVKVKNINTYKRNICTPKLVARMKVRQTNCEVSDIKNDINYILSGKEHNIIEKCSEKNEQIACSIFNLFKELNTNEQLEKIVKWYFEKLGADDVRIPPKNERGKEDGADADVVATFNVLHTIFYIQVKHHEKFTDKWAVQQITKYKEQKDVAAKTESDDLDSQLDFSENFSSLAWVITSGNDFTPDAKNKAFENGVQLLNGKDFARALAAIGVTDISDAFK